MDLQWKKLESTIKSISWQTSVSEINIRASWLFLFTLLHYYFVLHYSIFFLFIHTPSLTRSNTSLISKLISSVSCPTYWYSARQRGPWGRGCGFGAGGGRWLMLLLLCFLWQRDKPTKNKKSWRWLETTEKQRPGTSWLHCYTFCYLEKHLTYFNL